MNISSFVLDMIAVLIVVAFSAGIGITIYNIIQYFKAPNNKPIPRSGKSRIGYQLYTSHRKSPIDLFAAGYVTTIYEAIRYVPPDFDQWTGLHGWTKDRLTGLYSAAYVRSYLDDKGTVKELTILPYDESINEIASDWDAVALAVLLSQ